MAKRSAREEMAEINEMALCCDGFDDCIVGMLEQFGRPVVVLYDKPKMINKMVKGGMSEDEALEYFDFNITGAYVGEHTPAFMTRLR